MATKVKQAYDVWSSAQAIGQSLIGKRVEAHPATDAWMMGDRYGEIVKVGRKYVSVKMDKSGRTLRFTPNLLNRI